MLAKRQGSSCWHGARVDPAPRRILRRRADHAGPRRPDRSSLPARRRRLLRSMQEEDRAQSSWRAPEPRGRKPSTGGRAGPRESRSPRTPGRAAASDAAGEEVAPASIRPLTASKWVCRRTPRGRRTQPNCRAIRSSRASRIDCLRSRAGARNFRSKSMRCGQEKPMRSSRTAVRARRGASGESGMDFLQWISGGGGEGGRNRGGGVRSVRAGASPGPSRHKTML
jgi:hypothetical protein